jgi:hypothetical protein
MKTGYPHNAPAPTVPVTSPLVEVEPAMPTRQPSHLSGSASNSSFFLQARAAQRKSTYVPRRSVSLSDLKTQAPTLHELVGVRQIEALDTQFGSLQPPRNVNKPGYVDGLKPTERDMRGQPLMHPKRLEISTQRTESFSWSSAEVQEKIDFAALKRGEKTYLWAMGALGSLFVGEEEALGPDPKTGKPLFRSHPLLLGGGPARVCGQLGYDSEDDCFVLDDRSGRYSRYVDRKPEHLEAAAEVFRQSGLNIKTHKHVTDKPAVPLVLRTRDPEFNSEHVSSTQLPDVHTDAAQNTSESQPDAVRQQTV